MIWFADSKCNLNPRVCKSPTLWYLEIDLMVSYKGNMLWQLYGLYPLYMVNPNAAGGYFGTYKMMQKSLKYD